ncbi:hypothetical protein EDEG_03991 [Edhazardia aedis USNM 41457]|uniref:Uncharacterized protein n=1 Tax=Edhazardia aedis (strain USNM 41457) TaxID=1003232 RepID=J9DFK6_EDHAE|nr:hypothetical protein EDEG_03991 [Edhazardia aedis USNM 41457]|eukprot:EJW01385.1 hypothetical protein EDEG_03991 [Edhazardia aedis USNM 41457]
MRENNVPDLSNKLIVLFISFLYEIEFVPLFLIFYALPIVVFSQFIVSFIIDS